MKHALVLAAVVTLSGCTRKETTDKTPNSESPSQAILSVDEMASNPGLMDFKESLIGAFRSGDQKAVLSHFSSILEFDPGHSKGSAGVVEVFALDGSKVRLSGLESLLADLLSNGGCSKAEDGEDSTYSAPYWNCIPAAFLEKCEEARCGVIHKNGSAAYTAPDSSAKAAFNLSPFQIIPIHMDTVCSADFKSCDWTRISTFDGKSGFVPKQAMATEDDGLVWLVKEGGAWKIRVLRSPQIPRDDT